MGGGAQLAFLGLLGAGIVEESEGCGGGVGDEGVEDVGAVGEGAGDEGDDCEGELVDGGVVLFGWVLAIRRGEEGGRGIDVGAHEEAAGLDEGVGGGLGSADVETLGGVERLVWREMRGRYDWEWGWYLFEVRHHVRLV